MHKINQNPVGDSELKGHVTRRQPKWLFLLSHTMIVMRFEYSGLLIALVLGLAGCASSRSTSSGRTTVDYNGYSEDLSSVRPTYKAPPSVTTAPASRSAAPATTLPPTATAPRRNDTRKPTGPAEALHVNRRLDAVLDTIATKNRTVRYAPGFRVQVYVGNQRKEVESIKLLIYQNFPELSAYLSYSQPTYKLKVGDFMRRLDAERYYSSIRQLIASAQLQPDKVDVRRSLLIK